MSQEQSETDIKLLLEALKGILEIGKRDMSNPKYDGYFEFAYEVIAKVERKSQ